MRRQTVLNSIALIVCSAALLAAACQQAPPKVKSVAAGNTSPYGPVATRAKRAYSLKSIEIPTPDLSRYVQDERTLLVLGKALFWDMQLSSDSRVACASCHFHAGADHRLQNQLSSKRDPVRPNQVLGPKNVPLSLDAMAAGWRVGSAGIVARQLSGIGRGGLPDADPYRPELPNPATPRLLELRELLELLELPNIHGLNVRQVGARNAPSVINSVYSFRLFWDGRASSIFTGRTPFGTSDPGAHLLVDRDGALAPEKVSIARAGLASQAMEPPLDEREMSYRGRTWPMVGQRMLSARPLALQAVAPDDSVLGPYAKAGGRGFAFRAHLSGAGARIVPAGGTGSQRRRWMTTGLPLGDAAGQGVRRGLLKPNTTSPCSSDWRFRPMSPR